MTASVPDPYLDRVRELKQAGHTPHAAHRIAYAERGRLIAQREADWAERTTPDGNPLPGRTDPTATDTTSTRTSPSRSTSQEAVMAAIEEPNDFFELKNFLDTGVEEAEHLNDRAKTLQAVADSDLRLTPRLREDIADASEACRTAAEAVAELPTTLQKDLDI